MWVSSFPNQPQTLLTPPKEWVNLSICDLISAVLYLTGMGGCSDIGFASGSDLRAVRDKSLIRLCLCPQ